jgi:hypothetical protein
MALRLSKPQSMSQGASVSGPNRLNELMVGLSRALSARACASTPPIAWRPTADRPSGPPGSPNTFRPASSFTETCTWKPDPPSSLNGLAMKVASRPCWRAISCTADLSLKDRSAASTSPE